jgi:hypothetical protein
LRRPKLSTRKFSTWNKKKKFEDASLVRYDAVLLAK